MNPALSPSPYRYRLHRAGIRNVWQYDEQEFAFGGGRLLLRGKNGAGKSKALEMLLPYLLDGDARALDATGTGRTTLAWLMLDGFEQTNRLGYLWVEFVRTDEEATDHHLTLGVAIRASKSTKTAKPFFFTTALRIGTDLHLAQAGQPLPIDRLKDLVGAENVTERAVEHRARVARELFGLTAPSRYRNLLHLLHRLRRPTIGDRIDSGGLVSVLAETLPALDDEIVEKVARNLDDLDAVRSDLGRLERTDAALRAFLGTYRGYLHGVLRRRTEQVGGELDRLAEHRRAAGDAVKRTAALQASEGELEARLEALHTERDRAQTDLDALHASAGYRSLQELGEKRGTVTALHSAAATALKALRQAHSGQEEAGQRLTEETESLSGALRELGTEHRELLQEAERSGIDPIHLGEGVGAPIVSVEGPTVDELTAPDGNLHLIRHSHVQAVDTDVCATALGEWNAQLAAAGPVIRSRGRAVRELSGLIEKFHQAGREAQDADHARERLDEQAEEAAGEAGQRGQEALQAGEAYADTVRAWAGQLQELSDVSLDGVRSLVGGGGGGGDEPDDPLPAHIPDEVADAARLAVNPCLTDLGEQRDSLSAGIRETTCERDRLQQEYELWMSRTDPEPPPSPHRAAPRAVGTGAPLYRLVDFAEGLDRAGRAGLEAALEASGLLDAWVRADGQVFDPSTRDTFLVPGSPIVGASLDQVLHPVAAPGSGVTPEQVGRFLRTVALVTEDPVEAGCADHVQGADHAEGVGAPHSEIGTDGSWRLGVARGRHSKTIAEYVGAEVRAETRRRTIAELDHQLTVVQQELAGRQQVLLSLDERLEKIAETLRRPPSARQLTDALARASEAERVARALTGKAAAAAREAEQARAQAVAARREGEATATAHDLPFEPATLDAVRTALDRMQAGTEQLRRRIRTVTDSLKSHHRDSELYVRARTARQDAVSDYAEPLAKLEIARRVIRGLEEAIGATEQEILTREDEAKRRLEVTRRQLPGAQRDMDRTHDDRVRAEEDEKGRREALSTQEAEVIACGKGLRTALSLPGVTRGAGLDGDDDHDRDDGQDDNALNVPDPAHDDVPHRVNALRHLVEAVRDRLDSERQDVSDTTLLNRHTDLRDQLSGGYDATVEEPGGNGIKLCRLVDDHGPQDIAVVGARIAAQAAEARERLTEREREVFQRFLTGELGDHLSTQVLAAGALVAALNDTLGTVRTSHGLGIELDWKLIDTAEADVRAAVALLRSPSGLRTREQSEQLRDVLQRRIEDARRADPGAGYAAHLRTALDYRDWFTFTPWVVNDAAPGSRRKLSGRTGLSQGEQRVLSYLALFAAAAAHFTSLAETTPHAPRLILLDDAFAKVDEPTHGRLGRILVDLDLDFVLTSERLIGNWPDVPSLHIYECLRDPHIRGVATLHYTWNGRHRRLMSV
ncbi:TIGR02680 family protein [Streptomyces sp. NPDC047197]|uniref:TIGR02680 family protein n=1 Tax=Streptomyces sp. NPDC047197 TaxID=3155477 RepID=UPI0033E529D9